MNAKQILHQTHLQEWASRFADQKASGLTIKQWYEQNHFSIHTYNYWKHLLKEEVVDQILPDIVPLPAPTVAAPGSSSRTRYTRLDSRDSLERIYPNAYSEWCLH